MRKNEKRNLRLTLPKVLATGELVTLLTSMSPASVYASGGTVGGREMRLSDGEYTYNVNSSSPYPGVTIDNNKISYDLPGINSKSISAYKALNVYVNGSALRQRALLINSTVYLPARAFFEALGVKVTYSSSTKTLTARASGFEFSASDGGFVTYANARPLFSFGKSIIMSVGRMYIPATALTKATGTSFNKGRDSVTVTGRLAPLLSADRYYQSDEVFWLARIITAEARGESLLGQIAVGNVIMNRVASRQYPSTIYGVIFDRKWGVQFSPVLDGSIYNTPTYTATLAAQICLEGVKLSEDAMFFLNPVTAESNWIVRSREYLYSIGGHDFYK